MNSRKTVKVICKNMGFFAIVSVIALSLHSCGSKFLIEPEAANENVVIPLSFDYSTTHTVEFNLTLKDLSGSIVPNVVWKLYFNNPFLENGDLDQSINPITNFVNSTSYDIPSNIDSVYLVNNQTNLPGSLGMEPIKVCVKNVNTVTQVLSALSAPTNRSASVNNDPIAVSGNVFSLGAYTNTYGTYPFDGRDVISIGLKNRINTSLPEYKNILKGNYKLLLNDPVKANIDLTQSCQVDLTFVKEVTSNNNCLGYYYYPTGQKPTSRSAINKRIIVLPNASLLGSGGGLTEGDRVKLKYCDENGKWSYNFPAGYTISWFIIPKGFANKNIKVPNDANETILYSQNEFNYQQQQQAIALYDEIEGKLLFTFEDTRRNSAGNSGDQDFNDIVFYATVSPNTSIDTKPLARVQTDYDNDKDGIPDIDDQFRLDPRRAFKTFYPGANAQAATAWGTLAFEDLWPEKGDYDFNDVVINYQTQINTDANGYVVDVNTNYRFRAAGSNYFNSFAVQFNTLPSNIDSVTSNNNSRFVSNVFSMTNFVENDQSLAVIPVVDDILALFGGKKMVNTIAGVTPVDPVTVNVNVTFKPGSKITLASLGGAPFNPFIVVNKQRGIEVHLPGKKPTSLADNKRFKTGVDLTSFADNKFYTANGAYPWALHLPVEYNYSKEQISILDAYPNFSKWVSNNGLQFQDWYLPANANQSLIYK